MYLPLHRLMPKDAEQASAAEGGRYPTPGETPRVFATIADQGSQERSSKNPVQSDRARDE